MKSLIVRAISVPARLRSRACGSVALAIALVVPVVAFASAQVRGSAQSVTVDAQNSSIKEILSVLSKQLNLRVRSSVDLDKQATGTYQGSLPRVVARLLEGYNFIIRTNERGVEVTVLSGQGNPSTVQVSGIPAVQASTAVQSTTSRGGKPPSSRTLSTAQLHNPAATVASGSSPSAVLGRSTISNQDKPSGSATLAPLLNVTEGSIPVPNSSNEGGPVPRPATASLPTPKVSSEPSGLMPTPTMAVNTPITPMPTTLSTPFPGIAPQTGDAVPGGTPAGNGPLATSMP